MSLKLVALIPLLFLFGATSQVNAATIQGVEYNPITIGTTTLDSSAPQIDIPKISQLGANTVGLYNCGLFDWGNYLSITSGQTFCRNVYPLANQHNLGLIIGYFSNASVNWENSTVRSRATTQFKNLVNETKSLSPTRGYLIGNEVFEALPNENAKVLYAKWIGALLVWAQKQIPNIPIYYADNSELYAMPYLKRYAPKLKAYAINTYKWQSAEDLVAIIDNTYSQWNIPVLLHEWGVDSFDAPNFSENQTLQASRISYLAQEIKKVESQRPSTFLGALLFSYEDDFSKLGNPWGQDKDQGALWSCFTCFDYKANEEFWGIKGKPAYEALKSIWTQK